MIVHLIPRTSYLVPRPLILVIFVLTLLVGCTNSEKHADHQDTYTCPMHPTVVSNKPGTCPVCGMDLVRKAQPGEEVEVTEDLAKLIKSPNETVMSSIKTLKGDFKSLPVSLEVQGIVTYDTRNIYTIPARVGGRLEKVYIKYALQSVQKGQKVAEIYSPELLAAQRELVYLIENDPQNTATIDAAKSRLYLLGATQQQVAELIKTKTAPATFSIYSQHSGYILLNDQAAPTVSKPNTASSSSDMGSGMSGSSTGTTASVSPMNTANTNELMREGDYVSVGQTLFKVVNTSAMRVELDLPAEQASHVKLNDEIEVDLNGSKSINAKVDFVQPFFTDGEEFVKIRLYLKNAGDLRLGQLVQATIHLKSIEALWIPRAAVVDLGLDKVVFVKERGVFKPRNIKTGIRSAEWIEIMQGLSSSDEIASNAQYMIDSESFIKSK